jgi:arylsulfatase A-like enzyme
MALHGGVWGSQTTPRRHKPNILMILVDDLGFGDLACQGAPDMKTPHMDALMRAGMRLDPFYANCPVCSPTRAALLTGRYPDLAGVPGVIRTHQKDSWGYLSQHITTLPRVLKKQGYHTAMVGKWHLGIESPNTPNEQGFDMARGFLGDMMDDYWTHRRHGYNYMVQNGQTIDPKGHATDLFTQWSVEYITSRTQQAQPFFLYLAYNAPHTPIQPPEDWLKKVKAREPDITDKRAKLVALIEHLDAGIGQVIQALKDSGQSEDTLVVFTSDNGGQVNVGANNGALHGGKQDMWEGGIRVPCCAVWPGHIEPGARHTGQVAMTMDLYPTLCAAAEADITHPIDGINLLPTLLGQPQQVEDRFVFWVRREGGPRYGGRAYYAVRRGQWKLLQNTPFEPMQLFDLNADPGEQHPLPATHKMYRELYQALQNHINRASGVPWGKYPVDVDKVYTGQ